MPRFVAGDPLSDPQQAEAEVARHLPEFDHHVQQAVADCVPANGRNRTRTQRRQGFRRSSRWH